MGTITVKFVHFISYVYTLKLNEIKKKILFIDDEPALLELAPLLFRDYHVLASSDAENVCALISTFKPDIILVDVIMGLRDGVTVCREIKENSEHAQIPVVLMTAGYLRERDKFSLADGFIEKPFDLEYTIGLIESITSK
ncbi:PleD family two-component system response regulator [Pedobacter aquatilis]|uniref:response regulator n=1 Tax=Pedobacter aquatilis TaxID=351343 RepID=UPI00292EE518|nr:response regulator [Pedobacter aquatilis]